ncbi:MAG: Porphobilinogen deaminase [Planctomycetes bacterium ADurb.Bin401]|nr:MAG: Porphobilinogen deaminase [Planctomycetes bacterium ADurb.Bin401]
MEAISKKNPRIDFEIVEVKSHGDIDRKQPLWKVTDTGFFTAAIEDALAQGSADIAVHSYKDLPIEATDGLVIGAVIDRRFAHDCLICTDKINSIKELPEGATVGTSSLRRKSQILRLRPDLRCEPIRGNVHTRISQVEKGGFDATILAYAGIERLELINKVSLHFDAAEFLPSPGQGALAVEARRKDGEILKILAGIDDKNSRITSETERTVLHKIKAGCHAPAGVYSKIEGSEILICAFVSDENGQKFIQKEIKGPVQSASKLALEMAEELLKSGAGELLKND